MSRILEAWEQILRDAVSRDFDEQQFALFQIGLILQRHNPLLKQESDAPQETLSRNLLRLTLDEERQRSAVDYLGALIRKYPKQADTFLFAMSNAQPKVLVEPLLLLLQDKGDTFKRDTIYQALMALDSAFKQDATIVKQFAPRYDISPLLDAWAEHDDSLIADKADLLAEKIENLLEGEEE
jgi:hypothetical protein